MKPIDRAMQSAQLALQPRRHRFPWLFALSLVANVLLLGLLLVLVAGCQIAAPPTGSSESQPQIAVGVDGNPVLSTTYGTYHYNWSTWTHTRNGNFADFQYNGVNNYCFGDGFLNYAPRPDQFLLATVASPTAPRPPAGPPRPVICLLDSEDDGLDWHISYFTHTDNTDGMRLTRTTNMVAFLSADRYTPIFLVPKSQIGQGLLAPTTVDLPFDDRKIGRSLDDMAHVFIAAWDQGIYHLIRMDETGTYTAPALIFPAVAQTVTMQSPAFPPGGVTMGVNDLAVLGAGIIGDVWVDGPNQKIFVVDQGACHYGTSHICTFVSQVQNWAGTHVADLDDPVWNPIVTAGWSTDVDGGDPTVDTIDPFVASANVHGGIPVIVATQSNATQYPTMVIGFGPPGGTTLSVQPILAGTGTCDTGAGVWRCEDYPGIQPGPTDRSHVWVAGGVPGATNGSRSQGLVRVVTFGPADCKPPLAGCPL